MSNNLKDVLISSLGHARVSQKMVHSTCFHSYPSIVPFARLYHTPVHQLSQVFFSCIFRCCLVCPFSSWFLHKNPPQSKVESMFSLVSLCPLESYPNREITVSSNKVDHGSSKLKCYSILHTLDVMRVYLSVKSTSFCSSFHSENEFFVLNKPPNAEIARGSPPHFFSVSFPNISNSSRKPWSPEVSSKCFPS
ncbi:hypothetical protein PanWU01x14_151050 [Parasponia andersonii]|uniref:Uncharacterized protein n=1 Tax=Parasponia andersonii TaxID=3476 RepID=A0A2P5CI19_PARAD|nr:hypothetical protein PanWU01x14_151050 [Parasponia andersonii]